MKRLTANSGAVNDGRREMRPGKAVMWDADLIRVSKKDSTRSRSVVRVRDLIPLQYVIRCEERVGWERSVVI